MRFLVAFWEGGARFWLDRVLGVTFLVFSCHLIDVQGSLPWVEIFDVPWSRAPILRHSVGTCHRRFTMARWARVCFALIWVYWFSCFFV